MVLLLIPARELRLHVLTIAWLKFIFLFYAFFKIMENTFNTQRLQVFYNYAMRNDISILLVRQRAYSLLLDSMDDAGEIDLHDELLDKLITFLRTDEVQYATTNTVGLYAFQKHLSDIRKLLRVALQPPPLILEENP